MPPETVLTARGLVKRFAAPAGAPIEVLAGVDLVVRRGELVVIEGPSASGCSKTPMRARSASPTAP